MLDFDTLILEQTPCNFKWNPSALVYSIKIYYVTVAVKRDYGILIQL